MGEDALTLYRNMRQEGLAPNSVAFACLLQACASVGVAGLGEGKQLHADIREQGLQGDLVLGGSLVNMYSKCGSLDDARKLFDKLPERNIVAWGAMIAGYVQQGMGQEALELYKSMQQEGLTPNSVLYVCLLQACANVGTGALGQGKQLHAQIRGGGLLEDEAVAGSLVNMYAKCGSLDEARIVFEKLSSRDAVTWTAMIAGYVQQEMSREALDLYRRMQQEGQASPDCVTYVWLLQACSAVAGLPLGEQLHSKIEERGMQADSKVGAALVNMYAKCDGG